MIWLRRFVWPVLVLPGAVVIVVSAAWAQGYGGEATQYGNYLPRNGSKTMTGPLLMDGVFSTDHDASVLGIDRRNIVKGDQTTDAATAYMRIIGEGAWSGAATNTTGGTLLLAGGPGRNRIVMTAASCGGDTVTFNDDVFASNVCTENGSTVAGVSFDCTGETNAVCATNLATCLAGFTGITATANSPTSGTVYVQKAESDPASTAIGIVPSDGACANVTTNLDGGVTLTGEVIISNKQAYYNANTAQTTLYVGGTSSYLADGLTIGTGQMAWFAAPTFVGVAGGGTETVTNPATVYVSAAPTCTNVTCTNGPYAIWSDAGLNRLDGVTQLFDDTKHAIGKKVILDISGVSSGDENDYLSCTANDNCRWTVGNVAVINPVSTRVDINVRTQVVGIIHNDAMNTITLAAAATTFAVTKNVNKVDCDGGGNTIATITGGQPGIFCWHFVDASCTITDTAATTANTINTSAAFTSSADDEMCAVFDGNKWFETSRSVN